MPTKVEGLDKLKAKFAALPQAAQDQIRKAMEEGAAEMVRLAKGLAPVDQGELRESIGWVWGAAPKGSLAFSTGGSGQDKIAIFAGNDSAYYARWVEFGTINQPAQPYFFPAYRTLKKSMRSRTNRAIVKAVKSVAGNGQ